MDRRQQVIAKISALVEREFAGDYRAAFDSYDMDRDGAVSSDELIALLIRAQIGNHLTRAAWCRGIVQELDADKDGKIQWAEFESHLVKKEKQ